MLFLQLKEQFAKLNFQINKHPFFIKCDILI